MKRRIQHLLLLAATVGSLLATGCKSVDDTDTARPWNTPRAWESGLPAGMTEGR